MNVIVHPAHGMNENFVVLADAGDISPQARLEIFGDEFGAVFRAENDVEHVLGVGVSHVSRLRRLAFVYIMDPALPGWANFYRAYGAEGRRGFAPTAPDGAGDAGEGQHGIFQGARPQGRGEKRREGSGVCVYHGPSASALG